MGCVRGFDLLGRETVPSFAFIRDHLALHNFKPLTYRPNALGQAPQQASSQAPKPCQIECVPPSSLRRKILWLGAMYPGESYLRFSNLLWSRRRSIWIQDLQN